MAFKYKMDYKYRGRALIIGNEFKDQEKSERKGCKKDVKMMTELFTRLDFMVTFFYNLKAKEMENTLKKFAGQLPEHTGEVMDSKGDTNILEDCQRIKKQNRESDCFVCVISTHGEEIRESSKTGLPKEADVWRHAVLGDDNERLYVDQILNIFTAKNAPELEGKPKLFFIQACRSRGSDDRLVRISNPKYDYGFNIRLEMEQERGKMALLFKKVRDKLFKKKTKILKKHLIYSTKDDIAGRKNKLYAGWDKGPCDEEDVNDGNSEEDGNGSVDRSDEEDDEEEGSEDDLSSEDDERGGEDQEDAMKYDDEEDALMSRDKGNIPLPLSAVPSRPPPPIQELLPPTPFDVVQVTCPDDFLIMYPVMPGKSALRSPTGSYLLKYMHKRENASKLFEGHNLLQYITCVIQDIASYTFQPDLKMKSKSKSDRRKKLEMWVDSSIKYLSSDKALLAKVLSKDHQKIIPKNEALIEQYLKNNVKSFTNKEMRRILREVLPFKTAACVVHRLRDDVCFSPKSSESPMATVTDALSEQNKVMI